MKIKLPKNCHLSDYFNSEIKLQFSFLGGEFFLGWRIFFVHMWTKLRNPNSKIKKRPPIDGGKFSIISQSSFLVSLDWGLKIRSYPTVIFIFCMSQPGRDLIILSSHFFKFDHSVTILTMLSHSIIHLSHIYSLFL